jgi:hypothetical protein
MSDTAVMPTKAVFHSGSSDLHMLSQVEKWMATIREIAREERNAIESPSARLEHLLAPAAE